MSWFRRCKRQLWRLGIRHRRRSSRWGRSWLSEILCLLRRCICRVFLDVCWKECREYLLWLLNSNGVNTMNHTLDNITVIIMNNQDWWLIIIINIILIDRLYSLILFIIINTIIIKVYSACLIGWMNNMDYELRSRYYLVYTNQSINRLIQQPFYSNQWCWIWKMNWFITIFNIYLHF